MTGAQVERLCTSLQFTRLHFFVGSRPRAGADNPCPQMRRLVHNAHVFWVRSAVRMCGASCGLLLVIVGLAVMTGIDKRDETALVDLSLAWLTRLATRF